MTIPYSRSRFPQKLVDFVNMECVKEKKILLQEGIKPMWEDERNKKGGRRLINLDKKQRASCLDNFWLEVVSSHHIKDNFQSIRKAKKS